LMTLLRVCVVFSAFRLHRCGDRQDLPSFPTRRSSDLVIPRGVDHAPGQDHRVASPSAALIFATISGRRAPSSLCSASRSTRSAYTRGFGWRASSRSRKTSTSAGFAVTAARNSATLRYPSAPAAACTASSPPAPSMLVGALAVALGVSAVVLASARPPVTRGP